MTTKTLSPAAQLVSAYEGKATSYFTNARADFVRLLPRDPTARVLEIGCGNGATGALAMARGRAGHYVGVELMESYANQARTVLSDVLTGDVERMDFGWQPAEFDALISIGSVGAPRGTGRPAAPSVAVHSSRRNGAGKLAQHRPLEGPA